MYNPNSRCHKKLKLRKKFPFSVKVYVICIYFEWNYEVHNFAAFSRVSSSNGRWLGTCVTYFTQFCHIYRTGGAATLPRRPTNPVLPYSPHSQFSPQPCRASRRLDGRKVDCTAAHSRRWPRHWLPLPTPHRSARRNLKSPLPASLKLTLLGRPASLKLQRRLKWGGRIWDNWDCPHAYLRLIETHLRLIGTRTSRSEREGRGIN